MDRQYQDFERQLYDKHLLDDVYAGAGQYGFNKIKTIRDIAYRDWVEKLNLKEGEKVLDVGCNAGANLEKMRRQYGIKGTGIDLSPKTIQIGKKHFPELDLTTGVAENLPFKDNQFDCVVSFETLEHVTDLSKSVSEMCRVLKPGGKFLVYAISKRNALTWHWWQYKLTGGRLGTGALRDHLPHLMVPPEDFLRYCQLGNLMDIKYQPFHSFFVIIYDENIVNFLSRMTVSFKKFISQAKKQAAPSAESTYLPKEQPIKPAGLLIMVYSRLLLMLAAALQLLDLPWRVFNLSDGFFVLARKKL